MWGAILAKIEPYLSWLVLIALAGWMVYASLIKPVMNPTPTQSTKSGDINSYTYSPKCTFGCGGCLHVDANPKVSNPVK